MEIPITNPRGTVVGNIVIEANRAELRKKVNRSRGMLRRPPGWATDTVHLEALAYHAKDFQVPYENCWVVLTDDAGTMWSASLEQFSKQGFTITRGFGDQRVLPQSAWAQTTKVQKRLL